MTDTHRFSVSVASAVVREDGRILAIQRRDNGHWEPPGGVVESAETLQQAVTREVEEETGLKVSPAVVTGVYQNINKDMVCIVFRCALRGGELRAGDESLTVAWLTAKQVREQMDETYAVRFLDALQDTPPRVRTHNGVSLLP